MQAKWWRSGFFYLLLLVVVLALVFAFMPREGPVEKSLPDFISEAKQEQIDTIRQDGDTLIGLKDGEAKFTAAFIGDTNALRNYLEEEGVNLGAGRRGEPGSRRNKNRR